MATTGRSTSGADYTLVLGLDTSPVEKAQKRVESILKRTYRLERQFNNERVSAANRLLSIERRIANERSRGMRQPPMVSTSAVSRPVTASSAAPRSRIDVSQANYLSDDIASSRAAVGSRAGILDPGFVDQANRDLDRLQQKVNSTSNPRELRRLRRDLSSTNRVINQTIRNTERLNRSLSFQDFASKGLSDSIMNLGRSYLSVFAVIEGATALLRITTQLQQVEVALLNASGSAEQAGDDFNYVRELANRLGIELLGTAEGFGKFAAAARLGGLSNEETRKTFENIAKAVAGASLSAERSSLVFQAFQQVMSKGVLSMEEVRQQIGESLPQGMAALSRATGKSGQELFKFIESGEAISSEILPQWTAELAKLSEESGALAKSQQTVRAAWNRFQNSITDLVRVFQRLGSSALLTDLIDTFTELVNLVTGLSKVLMNVLELIGLMSDEAEKLEDKMGGIERIWSLISGVIKSVIANMRTAIALTSLWVDQIDKVGLFKSFSTTADITSRLQNEALSDFNRRRESTTNNAIQAPVNVYVNGSQNPSQVAKEVKQQIEQSWFSSAF